MNETKPNTYIQFLINALQSSPGVIWRFYILASINITVAKLYALVVGTPQWQPVALQASITQIGNENSIENQSESPPQKAFPARVSYSSNTRAALTTSSSSKVSKSL